MCSFGVDGNIAPDVALTGASPYHLLHNGFTVS
ncbi:hypothetical protein Mnod_0084 [Methylobacterium nodulans ORS 2060]|uniref:Uncharacterized protein n=1 Tax=Methylobacterium nodulans (strain LMG 21967 / CNCM I-2342 / ORS 2060) TaxID=460265 RepID=B8IU88_METNO|nr:hypothetical protein Mnod_0084 [Methylobacterium nodulans ORS 2060]